MKSDLFYAATARQIAREHAGLDPGPGLDVSLPASAVPMPAVHVDHIIWNTVPVETIPSEGGDLRVRLIAYRELALVGIHELHHRRRERDRAVRQHHRLLEENRMLRAAAPSVRPVDISNIEGANISPVQRRPLSGLCGVRGVR